jgi:hypothetical protein
MTIDDDRPSQGCNTGSNPVGSAKYFNGLRNLDPFRTDSVRKTAPRFPYGNGWTAVRFCGHERLEFHRAG